MIDPTGRRLIALLQGDATLTAQGFVQVQMAAHSPEAAQGFARLVATQPEVVAVWTLTGEADHLVRVWCANSRPARLAPRDRPGSSDQRPKRCAEATRVPGNGPNADT